MMSGRFAFVTGLILVAGVVFSSQIFGASSRYLEEYDSSIWIDHSAGLTSYYAKYNAWTEADSSVPRVTVWYRIYRNDIAMLDSSQQEFNTCCTHKPGQTISSSLSSAAWEIWAEHDIYNSSNNVIESKLSSDSIYYSSS